MPSGRALKDISKEPDRPRLRSVSQGYLESMRVRVLDGRLFTAADSETAPPVIVVNRAVARHYFGHTSPVGAYMDWHSGRLTSAL